MSEGIKRALLKLYRIEVLDPLPDPKYEWHSSTLLKETNFSTPFTFPFKKKTISELESSPFLHKHCRPDELTTFASLTFQTKVGGANHGGGSFEEVLSSTVQASAQSSGGGPRRAEEEELQC